jgi:hypothetical protein
LASLFVALCGLGALLGPDRVPAALHDNPVKARAVVTDLYLDGFGGDEMAAYEYVVQGHTYVGSGRGGQLGNGDVFNLNTGDTLSIEYAARKPAVSCTCDAAAYASDSATLSDLLVTAPFSLLAACPLAFLAVQFVRRARRVSA